MKINLILCLIIGSLCSSMLGQVSNEQLFNERSELRINGLALLAGPALDVSYERILSSSSGIGAGLFLGLSGDNFGSQNFALTPFYRFYFFDLKDYGARGFFVETFTSFASVRSYDGGSLPFPEGDFEEPKQKDLFQWSLGFAAGRKWVNKRGFSFEFFLGLGRYLLNTDYTDEVHPHIGANFGKRF
jgi:hypothetical protein